MALFDNWLSGGPDEGSGSLPQLTVRKDIERYIRGALRLVRGDDGLVRPYRFTAKQLEMLEHIGRGRRGNATSGVTIDLVTDGDVVAFDCRVVSGLDRDHRLYTTVMRQEGGLSAAEDGVIDGIDMVAGGLRSYTTAVTDGTISLNFDNPDHDRVEVRIFLPYVMSVAVGNLATNGSLEEAPSRGYLLALGDSITQGFVVGCPSLTYPALVATSLGLDLVNQGIAGHVFDRRTLRGLGAMRATPPAAIICAYGTNDWARKESPALIRRGAERYLSRLCWAFPNVPIYVMSPLWRVDEQGKVPCGMPLAWMGELLQELCETNPSLHFVDGYHAIPKNPLMLADGRLHPGSVGAGLVADVLTAALRADGIDASGVPLAPPDVEGADLEEEPEETDDLELDADLEYEELGDGDQDEAVDLEVAAEAAAADVREAGSPDEVDGLETDVEPTEDAEPGIGEPQEADDWEEASDPEAVAGLEVAAEADAAEPQDTGDMEATDESEALSSSDDAEGDVGEPDAGEPPADRASGGESAPAGEWPASGRLDEPADTLGDKVGEDEHSRGFRQHGEGVDGAARPTDADRFSSMERVHRLASLPFVEGEVDDAAPEEDAASDDGAAPADATTTRSHDRARAKDVTADDTAELALDADGSGVGQGDGPDATVRFDPRLVSEDLPLAELDDLDLDEPYDDGLTNESDVGLTNEPDNGEPDDDGSASVDEAAPDLAVPDGATLLGADEDDVPDMGLDEGAFGSAEAAGMDAVVSGADEDSAAMAARLRDASPSTSEGPEGPDDAPGDEQGAPPVASAAGAAAPAAASHDLDALSPHVASVVRDAMLDAEVSMRRDAVVGEAAAAVVAAYAARAAAMAGATPEEVAAAADAAAAAFAASEPAAGIAYADDGELDGKFAEATSMVTRAYDSDGPGDGFDASAAAADGAEEIVPADEVADFGWDGLSDADDGVGAVEWGESSYTSPAAEVDVKVPGSGAAQTEAMIEVSVPETMVTALRAKSLIADAETTMRTGAPGSHPEFDRLVRTVWRLRQPDGCPWDREQTHRSLTRNMVEEAYEAVSAIDEDDSAHLREELGDVLEQVLLHAQIADDEGDFTIDDVCRELNEKLVRRHPHVFGAQTAGTADEALDQWDAMKRTERREAQALGRTRGLLDSIPSSMPALMQCQKISERAAKRGFEWESVEGVWGKVAEERGEFEREERGSDAAKLEFGDLLFALVNVARHEGIDAEEALAASNAKFRRRWAAMERVARDWGRDPESLTPLELNLLWEHAKSGER